MFILLYFSSFSSFFLSSVLFHFSLFYSSLFSSLFYCNLFSRPDIHNSLQSIVTDLDMVMHIPGLSIFSISSLYFIIFSSFLFYFITCLLLFSLLFLLYSLLFFSILLHFTFIFYFFLYFILSSSIFYYYNLLFYSIIFQIFTTPYSQLSPISTWLCACSINIWMRSACNSRASILSATK